MGEHVDISASDGAGRFTAYLAQPSTDRAPAIVVAHEILGLNDGIRRLCDSWSARGFLVLAPDLYWRIKPGLDLMGRDEQEWQTAFDVYARLDIEACVADLQSALAFLRTHPHCNGRIGAAGFCLGGKLAYLMAARGDADACVGYYGVDLEQHLDEADAIAHPLMLHIAMADQYIPAEIQARIHGALDRHPHVTIHDYPGADHAFARVGGPHHDPDAARLAEQRTLAFFDAHLKAVTSKA